MFGQFASIKSIAFWNSASISVNQQTSVRNIFMSVAQPPITLNCLDLYFLLQWYVCDYNILLLHCATIHRAASSSDFRFYFAELSFSCPWIKRVFS